MPFSSINFLFLVPLLLMVYWALPQNLKRAWLCSSSVLVYIYAGVPDLMLLLAVTLTNWLSHKWLPESRTTRAIMIITNILVLGWFKYRFFIAGIFHIDHRPIELIVPLGISFYIFQLISYQVEIHKKILVAPPTFFSFFLYIFFFPHHQAGPIMRPHAFLSAFVSGRPWNSHRFKSGLVILLWGLAKKIWLADLLFSGIVNERYALLEQSHGLTGNVLFLGCLYGGQIYADFSGYSDIAVGLGKMFGFKLDRNFHQPYIAMGPSEFWRRWHVTLSQWLRDYIYIPLGGNRSGKFRTRLNMLIVMLVGGLWHGANWTFIVWGGLHGLFLIAEIIQKDLKIKSSLITLLIYQCLFMITWVPFREQNFNFIWTMVRRYDGWIGIETIYALLIITGIVCFSYLEDRLEHYFCRISILVHRLPVLMFSPAYATAIYIILCGVKNETTFIYQRF